MMMMKRRAVVKLPKNQKRKRNMRKKSQKKVNLKKF